MRIFGGVLLLALVACAHHPRAAAPAPSATAGDTAGWVSAAVDVSAPGAPAVLTGAAVTPQAGFDRVAFDFSGRVPGYHVGFETDPMHRCGSGDPVQLPGRAVLRVTFRGAAAHDDAGHATVAERDQRPSLDAVRALVLTCDFEGEVTWAIALPRATRFRVSQPAGAMRLVLDVEHPR